MTRLAFVMPAHGRHGITKVAFRALARTIERLEHGGVFAVAFVVTDQEPLLEAAAALGLGTIVQENAPLGRKFNDGYQAATDPEIIEEPLDFVIPIGSDDWIDPEVLLELHDRGQMPDDDEIVCFTRATFVSEDGVYGAVVQITYPGGLGVRVIPRAMLESTGYRPVAEDRMRAIDASTLAEITKARKAFDLGAPMLRYRDAHPAQIVDWKSNETQLNPFRSAAPYVEKNLFRFDDIAETLGVIYGDDLVAAMREQYAGAPRA